MANKIFRYTTYVTLIVCNHYLLFTQNKFHFGITICMVISIILSEFLYRKKYIICYKFILYYNAFTILPNSIIPFVYNNFFSLNTQNTLWAINELFILDFASEYNLVSILILVAHRLYKNQHFPSISSIFLLSCALFTVPSMYILLIIDIQFASVLSSDIILIHNQTIPWRIMCYSSVLFILLLYFYHQNNNPTLFHIKQYLAMCLLAITVVIFQFNILTGVDFSHRSYINVILSFLYLCLFLVPLRILVPLYRKKVFYFFLSLFVLGSYLLFEHAEPKQHLIGHHYFYIQYSILVISLCVLSYRFNHIKFIQSKGLDHFVKGKIHSKCG